MCNLSSRSLVVKIFIACKNSCHVRNPLWIWLDRSKNHSIKSSFSQLNSFRPDLKVSRSIPTGVERWFLRDVILHRTLKRANKSMIWCQLNPNHLINSGMFKMTGSGNCLLTFLIWSYSRLIIWGCLNFFTGFPFGLMLGLIFVPRFKGGMDLKWSLTS